MKQSKNTPRTAGVAGDHDLRSVQGGGTPLPARDRPRGPIEGTPLPAGPLARGPLEGTPLPA